MQKKLLRTGTDDIDFFVKKAQTRLCRKEIPVTDEEGILLYSKEIKSNFTSI